jgi:uncharacterized protein
MDCIKCGTSLQITIKMEVEIDFCPHCQGIWLDKGELEKIFNVLAAHYSDKKNYEADYEAYDYGDPDFATHHPNRRKKTFLDPFFDFSRERE